MRISTLQFYNRSVNEMLNQQRALSDIQNKMSTGKNINTPSDDPIGTAKLQQFSEQLSRIESYKKSIVAAERDIQLEESTLSQVGDRLQRVREITISAGNSSLGGNERKALATEIDEILKSMVSLANSQTPSGEYLFSGLQTHQKPIELQSNGRYAYRGDDGQRYVSIASGVQVATSDPGSEIFMRLSASANTVSTQAGEVNTGTGTVSIPNVTDPAAWSASIPEGYTIVFQPLAPNANFHVVANSNPSVPLPGFANVPYTPGMQLTVSGVSVTLSGTPQPSDTFSIQPAQTQDVFTALQTLSQSLKNATAYSDTFQAQLNTSMEDIDTALKGLNDRRATVGTRLNLLDTQTEVNDNFKLWTEEAVSRIQDLDYAKAVSDFSLKQAAFQAAQQTFVRLQGLSLLNFLG